MREVFNKARFVIIIFYDYHYYHYHYHYHYRCHYYIEG